MEYFFQPTMMQRYLHNFDSKKYKKRKNILLFLKEFSSTVPIMKSAVDGKMTFGGGFFVYYDNIGIAVDPGVGFLELLHSYGYSILDIDYVVVTHEHLDHSADLSKILSLNYDYNQYCKNQKQLNNFCKLDEHIIKVYCDEISYEKYENETTEHNILFELHNEEKSILDDNKIVVAVKPVNHGVPTYAVKINKQEYKTIAYSSDTAYMEGLAEFLCDADIIILNISEIKELEEGRPKRNHLGYNGVVSIISELKSNEQFKQKKMFISEFACMRGDNRLKIVKRIRKEINCSNIYPATIGLAVNLINNTIQCSICGFSAKNPIILKYKEGGASLAFVCDECVL